LVGKFIDQIFSVVQHLLMPLQLRSTGLENFGQISV